MTIDARSLSIENTGPATAVQCYQFYTEALDQIQFSRIRDACLAYSKYSKSNQCRVYTVSRVSQINVGYTQ